MEFDVAIIGAGVVGLACAAESASRGYSTVVIERHSSFGQETSSRNSEVIHSGIYYPTGSKKARLCVRANHHLYDECDRRNVWNRRCGKLIVAVNRDEMDELDRLYRRGIANGVEDLRIIGMAEARDLEPEINCHAAIYLPGTGIVDSHELMKSYLHEAKSHGADTAFGVEFLSGRIRNGSYVMRMKDTSSEEITVGSKFVINAGGLRSDMVARGFGIGPDEAGYRLHHNRGHYYTVSAAKSRLISHLVYPMPHRHLVSVGIHITIDKAGQLKLGPDTDYLDPSIPESDWYKFDESRRDRFCLAVRSYFPAIEASDLTPGQVGVRPKLAGSEQSVKDFIINEESDKGLPGLVNLIGIESPGLTCAREIAREVFTMIKD